MIRTPKELRRTVQQMRTLQRRLQQRSDKALIAVTEAFEAHRQISEGIMEILGTIAGAAALRQKRARRLRFDDHRREKP